MRSRPLRVLQLASTSRMGGAERMILNLVRHADPARVQPQVLTLTGPGHLTLLAMQAGVEAHNWALEGLRDPRLPRRMQLFLRAGRFDLVHTHGPRADLLARGVANGMQLPCVSAVSSGDPGRRWWQASLDRLTADGVTAWAAVCEAARRGRIDREGFPGDRIHVVYNGIPDASPPDDQARAQARRRLKLGDEVPVLATVASVHAAKGYPKLIDAVAILRRQYPDVVCLAAGRDDSGGSIPQTAASRGVADSIRWLGFVNDSTDVLAAADVVVVASKWEGCPDSLIEAMRAGRAAVATRVGGIPEMIEDGAQGLLVPPGESGRLAEAVQALLGDPDRRRELGHAGRRRFLERFTVDKMVEGLSALYERYAVESAV